MQRFWLVLETCLFRISAGASTILTEIFVGILTHSRNIRLVQNCWLWYAAARCCSPKRFPRASRISSEVAPFGTRCSKAVIQYVGFSRRIQQLCSATVSNWRRNTAHDVVPSNFGGFVVLTPVPLPLPPSVRTSTPAILASSPRRVVPRPGSWGRALREGAPLCLL
jgi:hypothetical protein